MANEQPRYRAFLLRAWQVASDDKPTWRASLESVRTGERHGFASLELLCAFLKELTRDEIQTQPRIKSE